MRNIEEIVRESRVIAVVGLSPNPDRDSYRVAEYLKDHGYRIIPINPTVQEVLGEHSYPDLLSVPDEVDVVDIFRRSEDVPPVVEQAIKVKAKAVWMQLGIINKEAAARAKAHGLDVVMDRCMLVEHRRLKDKESAIVGR